MQPIYILQPLSRTAAAIAEIQVPIDGPVKVGRDASNEFSVSNDSLMSSTHFEISAEPGGCRVRDMGSSNGLFLNTKRITNALLVEGDELLAGESRWRLAVRGGNSAGYRADIPLDQSRGYAPATPASGAPRSALKHSSSIRAMGEGRGGTPSILQLSSDRGVIRRIHSTQTLTIGRTNLADWVFDHDGQMSSLHIELFQQSGTWKVKDLKSSNGTYLNESRISESRLREGDEIRGGQTRFVVAFLAEPSAAPTQTAHSLVEPTASSPVIAHPIPSPPIAVPSQPETTASNLGNLGTRIRRLSDGREYELLPGRITELGRALALPISLADDLEVSTLHATLVFDGQFVQLNDAGSFNGTFLGTKRIATSQLADGQQFRVGQTEFLVCIPAALRREESQAPSPSPIVEESISAAQPPQPTEPISLEQTATERGDSSIDISSLSTETGASPVVLSENSPASPQPANSTATAETTETTTDVAVDSPPAAAPQSPHDSPSRDQNNVSSKQAAVSKLAEPSNTDIGPIDWQEPANYASSANELTGTRCRSGLLVYRGRSSELDPVDISLRLLQFSSGWVLNGGDIENWMEAVRQGLQGAPREWLNPAKADDASWMLPFLGSWGSGKAWLVFSSVALDEALENILSLRPISDAAPPLMPALTPAALATFLAERESRAVERFFQPFDAILVEIHAGQHWALFSHLDLQSALRVSSD